MTGADSVKMTGVDDRFRHAVAEMMQEREQVLVAFCSLLSIDAEDVGPYRDELVRLSELLTDYSALTHFEVIDPIISNKGVQQADDVKLIAAIQDTTEDILRFTDEYSASCEEKHSMMEFTQALNSLGERLAERFELEDNLLRHVQS